MIHKQYLVTFNIDNNKCWKSGITAKWDVYNRFRTEIKKGIISNFKIHKSSWFKTSGSIHPMYWKFIFVI